MSILQAIILAIVEGLTEYLPVSSTGHLIITEKLLGMQETDFIKTFTVCVQFGAILSVVVLYFKRFFQTVDFYVRLFCAFLPTAILGLLLDDYLDALLGNVIVVAISLLVGGIILLFVDNWFTRAEEHKGMPTYKEAAIIGLFQSLAMVPGVSRSAASIIGGMQQRLTRKAAAEFSFLLGVPTLFAASAKKLWDYKDNIKQEDIDVLLIGNVVGFVVAMLAIKFFIGYLQKYGFKLFGWYRIAVGLIILILIAAGVDLQVA